jgi:hypothetical protein
MTRKIDLNDRPQTYFRPQGIDQYLISKVKGTVMRRMLQSLFDEGRHAELRRLLDEVAFSEEDQRMLGRIHPVYMGGNYLPDAEDGEVEIATVRLKSTTFDVTSVFARAEDGMIHYRVVDEYGGDTLQGTSETSTREPMTLGEFADFFLGAWPLVDVVEMNFVDDLEGGLGFFSAISEFYPDLHSLFTERVEERFRESGKDKA